MIANLDWYDWFWLLCGIVCYSRLATNLWRRRAAGPILLDLGLQPSVGSIIGGALLVVAGLAEAVFFRRTTRSIAVLAVGLYVVADKLISRNQIREAGLLGRGSTLIRWGKISSYELSPAGSLRLNLQGKDLEFFEVAPEFSVEAEKLLISKVPGRRQNPA